MADSALKQELSNAMKDAMRAKDKFRLGTIRLALSEIKRIEVDERIEPDDARVTAIVDKMIKQRRESIKQYEAGGRADLAETEAAEIAILQEFMPKALSEAEIEAIVDKAISDTGAESIKDMGKVMGIVRPAVLGKADMAVVSQLIKGKLA
ncbi:MAG: GatB/YqeY domain-containing protein [Pseudohongiellaceae bacterium]|nr:GatB/YqeY domain-containing protein [Pseudohongiellaceae bacterium]